MLYRKNAGFIQEIEAVCSTLAILNDIPNGSKGYIMLCWNSEQSYRYILVGGNGLVVALMTSFILSLYHPIANLL
jgi:hypothetical protein